MNRVTRDIARAGPDDVPRIAALWHRTWHATHAALTPAEVVAYRDPDWFSREAEAVAQSALVAKPEPAAIVGFAGWCGLELGQLFVSESEYGRGTAAALLRAAEAAMAREGTALAFLYCRIRNERALRFYEKHGWMRRALVEEVLNSRVGPRPVPVWRMEKALARRRAV